MSFEYSSTHPSLSDAVSKDSGSSRHVDEFIEGERVDERDRSNSRRFPSSQTGRIGRGDHCGVYEESARPLHSRLRTVDENRRRNQISTRVNLDCKESERVLTER